MDTTNTNGFLRAMAMSIHKEIEDFCDSAMWRGWFKNQDLRVFWAIGRMGKNKRMSDFKRSVE